MANTKVKAEQLEAAQTNITSLGTLTALTISGDLTVDTNTLYVKSSNNRVGIGTTSPGSNLHIESASSPTVRLVDTTNDAILLAYAQDSEGVVGTYSNHNFGLYANSNRAMTIDTNLDVGIGTTSVDAKLHVEEAGEPGANGTLILEANSSSRQIRIAPPSNAANGYIDFRGGNLLFLDDGTEVARFQGSTSFNVSGKLGIGTDSPNNTLVAAASQTSYAYPGGGNFIEVARTSGADAGYIINKDTGQWVMGIDNSDGSNPPLRFEYSAGGSAVSALGAGTLGLAIAYDGKLGIGTATPQKTLHIEHTGGASEGILITGPSDTTGHTAGILLRAEGGEANSSLRAKGGIFFERTGTFGVGKLHLANNNANDNPSVTISDAKLTIVGDGSVGIGTDSPASKLHVYEETANTNTYSNVMRIESRSSGTTVAGFGGAIYFLGERNGDGALQGMGRIVSSADVNSGTTLSSGMGFHTATAGVPTEKLRISHDGKVGIGTDDPSDKLEVSGTGGTRLKVTNTNTDWAALDLQAGGNQSNYIFFRDDSAERARFQVSDGDDIIISSGSSPAERMKIRNNGYVDITGASDLRVTLGSQGTAGNNDSNWIRGRDTHLFYNSASGDHVWEVGGSETMKLSSGGNLAVTQSAIIGAASNTTALYSTTSLSGVGLFDTNAYSSCGAHIEVALDADSSWAPIYLNKWDWASGDDDRWMSFGVNGFGTDSGTLSYDGTNFAIVNASDYRLKENIVDYSGGLAKIEQLQVRSYNKKEGVSKDITQEGFIAHEAALANIPGLVLGEKDAMKEDESGNTVPDYQTINREALIPYLVSAIKELSAKVEALESK